MQRLLVFILLTASTCMLLHGASADSISVTVQNKVQAELTDVLIAESETDLDALRMRDDYTLNKPPAEPEMIRGEVDPASLEVDSNAISNFEKMISDPTIWEISVPVSERLSMEARAGYWPDAQAINAVGPDRDDPFDQTYEILLYGVGAKLDVGDKIYLRGDYTRLDSHLEQSGAFTIGGGVNLVQFAKFVNKLGG